jgi:hypothetical protein
MRLVDEHGRILGRLHGVQDGCVFRIHATKHERGLGIVA